MTTIDATWFKNLMQDSTITATNAEIVIQQAIDSLNTFGANISDLSGAVGTKTLAASSKQAGAIGIMSRETYSTMFKNASNSSTHIGGLGLTYGVTPEILRLAKVLASNLASRTILRT